VPKLTPEQRAELEAQLAADDADEDESYEVDWWEEAADGTRRGGRLPWAKAKGIYGKHFPDLFGDKPPLTDDGDDPAPKGKAPLKSVPASDRKPPVHFGGGRSAG
jgi:hypothetical protein